MRSLFFSFLILLAASTGHAESPGYEKQETATAEELQAADIAEHAEMMMRLEQKANAQAKKRISVVKAALKKRNLNRSEFEKLSEAEKKTKMTQAKRWAAQGRRAYDRSNFTSAESSFQRSANLDPNNESFYFMYGVSLYRNEKLEEALTIFKLANTIGNTKIEQNYYEGLIHFKLMEYWAASQRFKKVRKADIPIVSASAAFYEGVILYTLQDYRKSQEAFEWVLDHSKDPALDKKADKYLEQIGQALQMKRLMAKKWNIVASAGLSYDSNILFSPDNDSASAVVENEGGGRTLLQGSIERKIKRKKRSDLSAKLSSLYMYSFDSAFSRADPWLTSLGMIYGKRGETMRSKAYQYKFEPSGEILYMDADDDGTREKILTSAVLKNSFTIIQRKDYFAAYGLEIRIDNSALDVSSDDENSDAFKYILSTTHTWFRDETKKRAVIAKLIYAANDAKGKNKNFNRIKANVTYVAPTKKNNMWTLGLTAYKLAYPESDDDRRDTNVGLDYSYTRVKNENWSYTGVASYASNISSVDDNQYTRYSVMALATYSWSD